MFRTLLGVVSGRLWMVWAVLGLAFFSTLGYYVYDYKHLQRANVVLIQKNDELHNSVDTLDKRNKKINSEITRRKAEQAIWLANKREAENAILKAPDDGCLDRPIPDTIKRVFAPVEESK